MVDNLLGKPDDVLKAKEDIIGSSNIIKPCIICIRPYMSVDSRVNGRRFVGS